MSIRNKYAIAGIGETNYSSNSGRTELALAIEAIVKALEDAGLTIKDVDGLIKYSYDTSGNEVTLATALGIRNLKYHAEVGGGGGAASAIIGHAAAAIEAGMATTIVGFRSLNGRSGRRWGSNEDPLLGQLNYAFGWSLPVQKAAMACQRYMYEFGLTSRQLGIIAQTCRKNACLNPRAQMYGKPMTAEDYQASGMLSEPLRRFDCCLETDGACAVVITSAEQANNLRQKPAYLVAAAQGTAPIPEAWYCAPSIYESPQIYVAKELYARAAMGPKDIDVAELYDCFTFTVMLHLESFGFCKIGEAGSFVENGSIENSGELPINTHGGLLSEGYIHGFNHILEAVRQLRGTSTAQVKCAQVVLVTSGGLPGTIPSAMILTNEEKR
ncbi:lipid-transfer protein [Chloroflexota bacterium]